MKRSFDAVPVPDNQSVREYGHAVNRHQQRATKTVATDTPFAYDDSPTDANRAETLDQELRSIAGDQARLDVRSARCLRAIDGAGTWRHFGYPTILAYLEARLGICPRTARDRLRVARELSSLPLVEAALESGAISHSVVRELCRVADTQTEAAWLERARGKNLKQVEDLVRGRRKGSLPDDDKQPELETRKLTLEVSAATYALYRQTLAALSDEVGHRVEEDELIATMCRRTLEPAMVEPTRARHQIAVTVCESCRRGWQDGAGAVIEVDPLDVEIALCDAEHIGSLDAEQPARAHQDVSPATRRLVWRRDHGKCRVEGCRSARNLDVHHVVARADGGGHDASNLVVMCSGCHAALHRGLIEVSGCAELRLPSSGFAPPRRRSDDRERSPPECCRVFEGERIRERRSEGRRRPGTRGARHDAAFGGSVARCLSLLLRAKALEPLEVWMSRVVVGNGPRSRMRYLSFAAAFEHRNRSSGTPPMIGTMTPANRRLGEHEDRCHRDWRGQTAVPLARRLRNAIGNDRPARAVPDKRATTR